jgi:hypothetical protein
LRVFPIHQRTELNAGARRPMEYGTMRSNFYLGHSKDRRLKQRICFVSGREGENHASFTESQKKIAMKAKANGEVIILE